MQIQEISDAGNKDTERSSDRQSVSLLSPRMIQDVGRRYSGYVRAIKYAFLHTLVHAHDRRGRYPYPQATLRDPSS